MLKSFIIGLAGTELTAAEAAFLAAHPPCGAILFARNCQSRSQIRTLVDEVRSAVRDDILILIDQEGGRVQRLRPPLGRALPPAAVYGRLHASQPPLATSVTRGVAHLLAGDLRELGIDTDCAPVLDVPVAGSHDIIGDRAFGAAPGPVVALGGAFAEGLVRGGVVPVIKHIPGHGRATKDSHLDLPVVTTAHAELSRTDFATFQALAGMPAAMTAHVIFSAFDDTRAASVSPVVHERVIRGEIAFDGLLMSDDLNMHALSGTLAERAAAVIRAGSDVALHCSGNLAEMYEVAGAVPTLSGKALDRFEAAAAITRQGGQLAGAERSLVEDQLTDLLEGRPPRSESV